MKHNKFARAQQIQTELIEMGSNILDISFEDDEYAPVVVVQVPASTVAFAWILLPHNHKAGITYTGNTRTLTIRVTL